MAVVVAVALDDGPGRRRDRGVRVVVELAAADDRQPLVEQADEQPRHAGLGLAALAEEHEVVAGEDRVLDRRQDRVLEADDGRQDLAARGEALEQVGAELLLDGPRLPARGPELGDRGWAGARRHAGPQFTRDGGRCGRGSGGIRVGRRTIGIDGGADGLDVDGPGLSEAGQVVTSTIDLDLEVTGSTIDAERELRVDAPAEVLETIARRVPRREHGRAQALDVPVLVAGGRADVVGGDDPTTAIADAPQDQHDAEARQLVVVRADRRTAQLVEDLVERVGVDRRGQVVADRGRPDRDARLRAPGVGRQVVG